jgi:orotidine-5'-phosphate decarboxylase
MTQSSEKFTTTIESEAHPRPLTEAQLDDIEEYQFHHLHRTDGPHLNGRFVLSMIREIRQSRGIRSPAWASSRIIFALDVPDYDEANRLAGLLNHHVGAFKIGLELFMSADRKSLGPIDKPIMLDLKLHDIPETVERAVLRAGDLGVKFLTLHVQQRETLRRAAKAAEKSGIQLLAVTVLTSMTDTDLKDFSTEGDTAKAVKARAQLAWEEGITGFVTSPQEVGLLRQAHPKAILVTPGIRPAGADAGDQKRTGTPAEAVKDGADFLVIGRPIRDAANPVEAARLIAKEIAACP